MVSGSNPTPTSTIGRQWSGACRRSRGLVSVAGLLLSTEAADLPTVLNFPAPRLLCYSRESAVSEKLSDIVVPDIVVSVVGFWFLGFAVSGMGRLVCMNIMIH